MPGYRPLSRTLAYTMRNIAQALRNNGKIRMPAGTQKYALTRMSDNNKAAQPIVV